MHGDALDLKEVVKWRKGRGWSACKGREIKSGRRGGEFEGKIIGESEI